jgi:hypothetical protein
VRASATPDRLELEFTVASGGCLVIGFLTAAAPLAFAAILARQGDPLEALAPAGFGAVVIAIIILGRWLTRSRCVLDRLANEARIERHGLAPEDAPVREKMSMHAAIGPLDLVEGAEVLETTGSEGETFYKPALRFKGRKAIALTSYGSGSRRESDAAVAAIGEWLGRGRTGGA